jgi:hypothetical protein
MDWTPEDQIENTFELGSFNIEYTVIKDRSGAEIYRQNGFSASALAIAKHIT